MTKGAAPGHLGWSRRAVTHPQVMEALAEGTVLTESMARTVCGWTDKLPEDCRQPADAILVAAARAPTTTRLSSIAGAGPWSSTQTAPPPPGTPTYQDPAQQQPPARAG